MKKTVLAIVLGVSVAAMAQAPLSPYDPDTAPSGQQAAKAKSSHRGVLAGLASDLAVGAKVATFPVRHPKKSAHGVKVAVKGAAKL